MEIYHYRSQKDIFSMVNSVTLFEETLFIGGTQFNVDSLTARFLIAMNPDGPVDDWGMHIIQTVHKLLVHEGKLYAGGDFGIAVLDMP